MVEQLGISQAGKGGQQQQKGSAGKRKREETEPPKAKATPKKAAASAKSKIRQQPPPRNESWPTSTKPSTPTKKPRIKQEYTPSGFSPPTPRIQPDDPKTNTALPKPRVKREYTPSRSSSAYIKQEPSPHDPIQEQGNILLSGTYKLNCPTLHVNPPYLTLYLDEDRSIWWITLTYDSFDFLIQMDPGPSYEPLGVPCTLGWRVRDGDTGRLYFGKGCTGEMTFYEDQTLSGVLKGVPRVGTVEIWSKEGAGAEGGWRLPGRVGRLPEGGLWVVNRAGCRGL